MSASTSGFYSSIEPDVLGVTLRYATKSTVSDYLHQKVWEQIGAESDASWMIDAQGFEVSMPCFVTTRDSGDYLPMMGMGRQADHSRAVDDRCDHDPCF
jgi:CubicO group peptidase (beta-lactamase class C family)